MRNVLVVSVALLLAFSVVAMAGGDQNQNQKGKEDGTPGNGDQVKERERPDDPAGECPNESDCSGCPDCDGSNGPNGPKGPRGDCDGDGPIGPGPGDGTGDGEGPFGPGNGDGDDEGGDGPFGPGDCD